MNGDDIRAAIAAATPLGNPRLSEVEWDDVAACLAIALHAALREDELEALREFRAWLVEGGALRDVGEDALDTLLDRVTTALAASLAASLPAPAPDALREAAQAAERRLRDCGQVYGHAGCSEMAVRLRAALAETAEPSCGDARAVSPQSQDAP